MDLGGTLTSGTNPLAPDIAGSMLDHAAALGSNVSFGCT